MLKTLSEEEPFNFLNILFSIFWIGVFGLGVFITWLSSSSPWFSKWLCLLIWMLGVWVILRVYRHSQQVRCSSQRLYVVTRVEEISIPFEMIDKVTENRWFRGKTLITVHLRNTTKFGKKIRFFAKPALFALAPSDSHPIAQELRCLAAAVKNNADNLSTDDKNQFK